MNFDLISATCNERNIEWYCFRENRFLPRLEDKLIVYPFNSRSNAMIVANRTCYHALLMHGESNKEACIKPLARLYDYVLVAGEIACARLVEYGILTQDDIDRGRTVKLGETVMGDFKELVAASGENPTPRTQGIFGYFPTWEGGDDKENLCSLPYAQKPLLDALAATGIKHVAMRFHPNTGERLHNYRQDARDLIETLNRGGYKITYVVINRPTSFELNLQQAYPEIHWHNATTDPPIEIDAALVDVSALEAILDEKRIPNLVCVDTEKFVAAPKLYWKLKSGRHIFTPDLTLPAPPFDIQPGASESYRKALISYSDEKLENMSHSERMVWLNAYVREGKFWSP